MTYQTLRHPKLPKKQTITVHDGAVHVHELSGWVVIDKDADAPEVPVTLPAEPAATKPTDKTKE